MAGTTDIVIVGGGLEGLAIAWSLAERGGVGVTVLERGTLCSGMTAKSSGIVRCHYGVPSLAAMARDGAEVFSSAEQILGADVGFRRTSYIVGVGEVNAASLRANVAMHRELGIEVELVDHDAVAQLWPGMRLDDFAAFAHEPGGGHGDAYLTGMAFAKRARELGVQILQGTPVEALRIGPGGDVIGVELGNGDRIDAGAVVLASGVWSPELAGPAGLDLPIRPQREQILLVGTGEPLRDVPVFSDLVNLQYFRGEPSGELLVGNSDHSSPEFADPDDYSNRADPGFVEVNIGKLDHRLPAMPDPRIASSYAGCYDVTPDYNPIIGPAPVENLFLAVGFSGHGYKISPAVGKLAADLLLDGASSEPSVDAADFRFERFAEGRPLVSRNPYRGAGEMR
ncbi:FAD-dependent oxidoreductase [Saccharopolyspora sp. NPDC002686]|uniref:NAD(P)/FAD-dependent oxidoreductase n=1 Tax=Saccharopolyspora sp. NPDC002686 TaxID=3154541 RepID=UPI00332191B8